MIIVVNDKNFTKGEKVKVGIQNNKDNKSFMKYDGTLAIITSIEGENSYRCKMNDDTQITLMDKHVQKLECPLVPGEELKCCQDKECDDVPIEGKQTFIFCEKCSSGTKNFIICYQHAYEYEDSKKMRE